MALMIEKKREKAGTREINRKNGGRTHNFWLDAQRNLEYVEPYVQMIYCELLSI
jgi:hypothetical protein